MGKKQKFAYSNTGLTSTKPETVRQLWGILEKMDAGSVCLADSLVVSTQGNYPGRSAGEICLTEAEVQMLAPVAIPDGSVVDKETGGLDETCVDGVIITVYQLIELAYSAGIKDGKSDVVGVVSAITSRNSGL